MCRTGKGQASETDVDKRKDVCRSSWRWRASKQDGCNCSGRMEVASCKKFGKSGVWTGSIAGYKIGLGYILTNL